MTTSTRAWLHSLAAAGVGGLASATLSALAMPDTFNSSSDGLRNLAKAVIIGAIIPVATLLKQSPLPPDDLTQDKG